MPTDVYRFSRRVPNSGVNLAWIQLPDLEPTENVNLIETGRFIAENLNLVWDEVLEPTVIGELIANEAGTGFAYLTTYNAEVSVAVASGQLTSGAATYAIPRLASNFVSPSGFVVQNFTSEIRVFHPVENDTGVWRLRVQDGVIVRRHVLRTLDNSWLRRFFNPGDELVLYYSVPEAMRIPYLQEGTDRNTYEDLRVVDVSGVVAEVIDERTLQLPDEDLLEIRSLRLNGEELIQGSAGSGYISVEDSPLGELVPPRGPFQAWDPLRGTLTLTRSVDERDEILVSYRYREYLYTFEGFFDENLGAYRDLDFNPTPGHTYDRGRPTSELLNIPIYLYLIPTAAYREVRANGVVEQDRKIYIADRHTHSFLRWELTAAPVGNSEALPASNPCLTRNTFGHSYFGTAVFVEDTPVDSLATVSVTGTGLANLPSAVILAKIFVTPNSQVENVQVIDTRTRGGGILEETDVTDPRLPGDTRKETSTYWDIGGWDGQPVPLNGVLIVELPGDILTGANSYTQFSQDEVEEIVRGSVAAGIRVIVRYV